MRALSAGELLDVWEAGFAQALTERALALLAVALALKLPVTLWRPLASANATPNC